MDSTNTIVPKDKYRVLCSSIDTGAQIAIRTARTDVDIETWFGGKADLLSITPVQNRPGTMGYQIHVPSVHIADVETVLEEKGFEKSTKKPAEEPPVEELPLADVPAAVPKPDPEEEETEKSSLCVDPCCLV